MDIVKSESNYDQNLVLIPGLDLFNHALNPSSIPASSQIFTHYGPKSNEDLLMDYGFVVPDNKYDTYRFRLDDSYDVTPRMEKLLHNKNLDHRKTFDLTMEGLVSEDLRDVRRIIVVDDLEVDSDYDSDAEEDFEDRCKANEPSYGRVELDFVGHLSATLEERQDDVYQDSYGGDECRPTVVENCREYKDALEKILDVTRDHLEERKENLWYFVEEEARY